MQEHDTRIRRDRSTPILAPENKLRNLRRLLHLVFAASAIICGVWLLLNEAVIREWEAILATAIASLTYASESMFVISADTPAIGFTTGGDWLVLRITAACAIVWFLGPVAILSGLLALSTRFSLVRIVAAAIVGMAGLVLLNQLRFALINTAWSANGLSAFHWMHGPVGTLLMLLGISGTLLVFLALVIRRQAVPRTSKG